MEVRESGSLLLLAPVRIGLLKAAASATDLLARRRVGSISFESSVKEVELNVAAQSCSLFWSSGGSLHRGLWGNS